jgi:hypothetical protein
MIVTLASAQRYCLETRALLDKIIKWDAREYHSETYPPANSKLLGCITDRVPVLYDMYEKGVLVWFVRPPSRVSSSTNICEQGLILPPTHFGIKIKQLGGVLPFYQGRISQDMVLALENWRPGPLDLNLLGNRSNSEADPSEEGISATRAGTSKKNKRTQPCKRFCIFPSILTILLSCRFTNSSIGPSRLCISMNLVLLQESRSSNMPRLLDAWKQALAGITMDAARIVQHPDSLLLLLTCFVEKMKIGLLRTCLAGLSFGVHGSRIFVTQFILALPLCRALRIGNRLYVV